MVDEALEAGVVEDLVVLLLVTGGGAGPAVLGALTWNLIPSMLKCTQNFLNFRCSLDPQNKPMLAFNPSPNKPLFLCVCSTHLLKTLWEKEKLLVTSNFSIFQCF